MRKSALLAFSIFFSLFAAAYPISPRPLRLLIMESEFIITGRVLRITDAPGSGKQKDHYLGTTAAVIEVSSVLKGSGFKDSIYVFFEPGMICPAPAQFFENTKVLVFLDRTKGKYHVHALSYGAKTLDDEGTAVYTSRINEMLDILDMPESQEKTNETIEWLVKCAENTYTRWEGSYDLHAESDFMSYYSNEGPNSFKYYLSEAQRTRLKNSLIKAESFQYSMLPLIDLTYRGSEKEMDELMEKFLATLDENQLWAAGEIMQRLQHKVNEDSYKKISSEFNDALYTKGSLPDTKKAVQKFIQLCIRQ